MIQIHSDDLTLNNFCLVGRAGKDPEIKYLEEQMSVAKVSLASRKNKEATDWFQVEAWNKTAEIMKNYLRKGNLFAVQGKLMVNEWTSNEETHRQSAICVVSSLELLGSKKDEALPF
jgi:single-strand DNA-binding protein